MFVQYSSCTLLLKACRSKPALFARLISWMNIIICHCLLGFPTIWDFLPLNKMQHRTKDDKSCGLFEGENDKLNKLRQSRFSTINSSIQQMFINPVQLGFFLWWVIESLTQTDLWHIEFPRNGHSHISGPTCFCGIMPFPFSWTWVVLWALQPIKDGRTDADWLFRKKDTISILLSLFYWGWNWDDHLEKSWHHELRKPK